MTENSEIIITEFAPLPCNEIVYRALMNKKWLNEDTGKIRPGAFFLRKHRAETGLSVNISAVCSPEDCAKRFRCKAIASLHVGSVRDLGLDVVQDGFNHANITGLPYQEDNLAEAERLAGLLAKQSRVIRI
jgi:hypothetical protein